MNERVGCGKLGNFFSFLQQILINCTKRIEIGMKRSVGHRERGGAGNLILKPKAGVYSQTSFFFLN